MNLTKNGWVTFASASASLAHTATRSCLPPPRPLPRTTLHFRAERPSTRLHHPHDADVRTNFQTPSAMYKIRTCTVEQIPDADRKKFPTPQYPLTRRCFHWKLLPSTCQTKTEGELRILCCERSLQFCRCTTKTLNGFHSAKHNTVAAALSKRSVDSIICESTPKANDLHAASQRSFKTLCTRS